jgi:hypothetical protein
VPLQESLEVPHPHTAGQDRTCGLPWPDGLQVGSEISHPGSSKQSLCRSSTACATPRGMDIPAGHSVSLAVDTLERYHAFPAQRFPLEAPVNCFLTRILILGGVPSWRHLGPSQ